MDKMLDYDHEINLTNLHETHTTSRHAQRIAGVLVIIIVLISGGLLFYGKKIEAMGTLIASCGIIITSIISSKLEKRKKDTKD